MFPSAIVFPRPPTAEELEYPPFDMVSASAFLAACVFIAALLFLVVRDQVVPPWRSVVSVLALFALVEAYLYWMPHLGEVGRILLAVPVLGAVWELTPKVTPSYLPGDRRAWILVAPILVASVLVLLLKPYQGFSEYSVAEELGRYLLWALFQQFVVAVLIMSRLGAVFGRIGIVLSAGVFGLFHFPNFAMMAGAFLLGLVLLHIYDRHQNLLAIAAAQAFVAVSFNNLAMQYDWLSRTIGPEFVAGL
jgi:hypothetical protein